VIKCVPCCVMPLKHMGLSHMKPRCANVKINTFYEIEKENEQGDVLACQSVKQCDGMCCSVLQCVAVCCSVLQWS